MSFCGYFLTALIILKQHFSAAEYTVPPAPTLTQTDSRDSSVELLCQAPEGYGGLVFKLFKIQELIDKVEHSNEQQAARFILKGEDIEKEISYCCQYDLSMISQYMTPEMKELPVPTLSLSRHKGAVLECVGSPSYPQGFFYLFRVGVPSPEETHQASLTQHSARFPIPTRYEHDAQYQCQYSVSLGKSNAYSKMSSAVTIPCITGYHNCTPTSTGSTDLALIGGSVSGGVLFLMVVAILGFAVHKHFKNMLERKRQRDQLWQHVSFRDYTVDLTLQHVDIESEGSGRTLRGRPSFSDPIYENVMATFKNPSLC
ncbi:uncharacterized protein LOC113091846 [Carassius auratus]|uniref:Uncharacterized protein LOC113091846 n=1 Tax=Carassius auratus TaxID=7957 RepID=A0A6P6NX36_CARAU|nr:uncharacterized protein LOC113091846 [Carassius auratus]